MYREYLTKEVLEGFGNSKIGGIVNLTMIYADELVPLTEKETVLHDIIDRLTEIGKWWN